jgi:hypothetical protein
VDWTALLEERSLIPDSEEASPVAHPQVRPRPPRRRRNLLHVLVAVTAIFSVVASAAVVITLVQANSAEESKPETTPALAPALAPAPVTALAPPPEVAPAQDNPVEQPAPPKATDGSGSGSDTGQGRPKRESAKPRERSSAGKEGASGSKKSSKDGPDSKPEGKASSDPASRPALDPDRPEEPSVKDLVKAVEATKPRIDTCARENGVSGSAAIKLQVEPDGKIAWAAVREGGEAFQACVSRVLREVRLPPSQRGGTLVHSVRLPDP